MFGAPHPFPLSSSHLSCVDNLAWSKGCPMMSAMEICLRLSLNRGVQLMRITRYSFQDRVVKVIATIGYINSFALISLFCDIACDIMFVQNNVGSGITCMY